MDLNEFITAFAEQFDETSPSEINAHTDYRDLVDWGSLTALSVIAMVKTQMNKKVTGEELYSCPTVGDLYNLLNSK
jgi:acyl carrier protein